MRLLSRGKGIEKEIEERAWTTGGWLICGQGRVDDKGAELAGRTEGGEKRWKEGKGQRVRESSRGGRRRKRRRGLDS